MRINQVVKQLSARALFDELQETTAEIKRLELKRESLIFSLERMIPENQAKENVKHIVVLSQSFRTQEYIDYLLDKFVAINRVFTATSHAIKFYNPVEKTHQFKLEVNDAS